jgi:ferredoxin-NADP reductase
VPHPIEHMATTWINAHIVQITNETPNTRRFWLRRTDGNPFLFKPGQFVTLDLPVSQKRLQRWRSYSIASPPNTPDPYTIELCIVHVPNGLGSTYLFNQITVGSTIALKEPSGNFQLPTQITRPLVFICTGTGIAPFRSMLQHIATQHISHPSIHLIFGTRTEADLLYRAEMQTLQNQLPHFTYTPVLSRQPDWQGAKGRVHTLYEQQYAHTHPHYTFYICGWSAMVDETIQRLQTLGVQPQHIISELYA